tara:strand:+ start:1154 stop:1909 length:756 start_codon:yes stop_codon:yes gene_type:complete
MTDIFLGIIQGITEFLPISSSGHLVIFDKLFPVINLNTNDIAFLHIGTLFSIVIFYRDRILQIFSNLIIFKFYLKIIIFGILPAVIVGLLTPIQEAIDNSSQILIYTGIAYFFLSVLLIFSERIASKNILSIEEITINQAFMIGIAQAFALMPGISRSGVTLLAAMYLGLKKADAIFYSMLIGIPTIFGAWSLTFINQSFEVNTSILIPTIVAFLTGILAIKLLVKFTTESKLQFFGFYCLILSIISFGLN